MTIVKRQRGRPTGTGKPDDPILAQMADLMVSDPALRHPTTAAKRIVRSIGSSHLRRLQVKWRERGIDLLSEARARAAEHSRVEAERRTRSSVHGHVPESFMHDYLKSPAWKAVLDHEKKIQDFLKQPWMKAMQNYQNSPEMKAALDYEKKIQDLLKQPWMKAMQEYLNSPAMKALHSYQNHPEMKAVLDYEKKMHDRLHGPNVTPMLDYETSLTMRTARS